MLKIQNAREQAGIHFTDDETGEIGVRLQIGKRRTKRSLISSRSTPWRSIAAANGGLYDHRHLSQFSTRRSSIRKNSRSLSVTTAWPKISA